MAIRMAIPILERDVLIYIYIHIGVLWHDRCKMKSSYSRRFNIQSTFSTIDTSHVSI